MIPALRVLILEDNPFDAELLIRELRRDFEPQWTRVENAEDFKAALATRPEIILSDYNMPSFNAPQALELLRQSGRDIPFIIVSGEVGESLAVECMKQGAADYLLKDRLTRLGQSIRHALEQSRLRLVQKLMQDQLKQSEERFREMAENIHEVFWIDDMRQGNVLYISPAYEMIWGRSRESLYAEPRSWQDSIHEDDRKRVSQAHAMKHLKGKYDEVYRIIRPDGTLRWIHDRAFPVENASGDVERVVGVAQDITEGKLSHDRLREQASLLDKAQDAILVRDLQNRVIYWNEGATRLYGWTAKEAAGRQIMDLLYRRPAQLQAATQNVMAHGEWSGELQHLTKEGKTVTVESRWTLVRDDAGAPRGIFSINTDVTEKRKLEQQFLRAQRLENIGTLASGIAHDLNNVLSPILMSIDLLKMACRDERSLSMLSTIDASARRGADMVRQILSFARGVEGRHEPIDLRRVIHDIQHLVRETFPKNIQCECALAETRRPVMGDQTQIHQVLLNLCVNARDAMPSGGRLTISASEIMVSESVAASHGGKKTGPHVLIEVSDTGTGMSQEVLEKIFDPFFTTKEIGKGTGLGLSTVLSIVKSHGGMLDVRSVPGTGTTFAIYLPAELSSETPEEKQRLDTAPHGNGELILVVDDEQAVRTITQQTLEVFGYRTILAADGAQALALYLEHRNEVAAVILDLMMPVMSGEMTAQLLQRINPGVRIIACSGVAKASASEQQTTSGISQALSKPFTTSEILNTLNRVLKASTAA